MLYELNKSLIELSSLNKIHYREFVSVIPKTKTSCYPPIGGGRFSVDEDGFYNYVLLYRRSIRLRRFDQK